METTSRMGRICRCYPDNQTINQSIRIMEITSRMGRIFRCYPDNQTINQSINEGKWKLPAE